MKTIPRTSENKRLGTAMVTLMIIVLLVSYAGAAMVGFAKQQSHSITRVRDYLKAQAYAEAGANDAYSILKQSFANAQDPALFPARQFGDGGYDATVTPVGSDQASIESVGQCGNATITVKCDVMNMGPSSPAGGGGGGTPAPEPPAYDYAILCGGDFFFRGCGDISGGGVGGAQLHANGYFRLTGNAGAALDCSSSTSFEITSPRTLYGNAAAPTFSLHKKANITGTTTVGPVELVEIPDIDLTPYYNYALANGEVHNGFTMTSDYTPNGGVMWVNGDVHFSSWAKVNGSIIATGDIHTSGHVEVNATTCAFALCSRDGDIHNTSGGKITGLIYAKSGNYHQAANGETEGQLIIKGDIDKGGNSDILVYGRSIPIPPDPGGGSGSSTGQTDHVVITAWQQ